MELRMEAVTKRYKRITAVDDISITLTPGVYGLLGPNGAGKTTLMNMLVANLLPTSGGITYDGEDIQRLSHKYLKKLGYMPQQQYIYPYFTGYQFLAYMAALKGIAPRSVKKTILEVADMVNMRPYLHRKVGSYSGGMKQRILIAQTLLNNPAILILDEPTAGLDPLERVRIRNLISGLSKDRIVLVATHVVQDIECIASYILVMDEGKIVLQGKPQHILNSISDKVFEAHIKSGQLDNIMQRERVVTMTNHENQIYVRVVSDRTPQEGVVWRTAVPTLEDLYIYTFCNGQEQFL